MRQYILADRHAWWVVRRSSVLSPQSAEHTEEEPAVPAATEDYGEYRDGSFYENITKAIKN